MDEMMVRSEQLSTRPIFSIAVDDAKAEIAVVIEDSDIEVSGFRLSARRQGVPLECLEYYIHTHERTRTRTRRSCAPNVQCGWASCESMNSVS